MTLNFSYVLYILVPWFLSQLGDELERMHPRIYTGVARQMCRAPSGEFHSAETITLLLGAVGRDLFRSEITWSKVISLFAIAGGLSVDFVRQGHPEYVPKLVDGVSEVIEDELVSWINENGGWVSDPKFKFFVWYKYLLVNIRKIR